MSVAPSAERRRRRSRHRARALVRERLSGASQAHLPDRGGVLSHAVAGACAGSSADGSRAGHRLAIWAGATVANASDDPAFFEEHSYTVRPGDTLWEVAASHYGDTGTDLREVVWKIERRNGLDGAALSPGRALVLPPASAF